MTAITLQTRAAWLSLDGSPSAEALVRRVDELVAAGYDSIAVPLLSRGDALVEPVRRGRRKGEPDGRAMEALKAVERHPNCSVWLAIDPLTAGLSDGTLSDLARRHREWLLRNTSGRRQPVGNCNSNPLFSWMNMSWRRFVGEMLMMIVCRHPINGIIMDLRAWPGRSDLEDRWYCCSFDSQVRAEQAVGLSFEFLLAEGTRQQIEAWQTWVTSEMRAFVESLMGRTRVFRSDLQWRLFLPPTDPRDHAQSPWVDWIADHIVSEVILSPGGEELTFEHQIEAMESVSGTRLLAMTAGPGQNADDSESWPFSGTLDLQPSGEPAGSQETILPAANPLEHALQLIVFVENQMEESRGRRFVRHARRVLEGFDATPEAVAALHERVRELEDKIANGRFGFQKEHSRLIPEARLCLRLLGSVQPNIPVY